MKAVFYIFAALLLTGCSDTYRYPCQDPANSGKPECSRPLCEADGMCFDTLNGLPPKQAEEIVQEETAAPPAANCNTESTGE